ncbi:MAG: hypothetical protein FWD64_11110, partial [Acidobacteriaceae bacterium]|nr:hypothetical protein [Acidobacteriaceae bacterium]
MRLNHIMHRRRFLGQLATVASLPLVTSLRGFSAPAAAAPKVPKQIKAFNIDFNWYMPGEGDAQEFAPPGHFAEASPEYQIRWYHDMGVNVIHTFAVSCDGYAWYRNGFVPAEPGLKYDFLPEMVRLGHKKGMMIMGYFCVGGNSKWGKDHPDLSYGTPSDYHIPFTDTYLDYLTRSMEDALRKTGIDGFMIDWVWNPNPKLRASGWIPAEQKLFTQLTG